MGGISRGLYFFSENLKMFFCDFLWWRSFRYVVNTLSVLYSCDLVGTRASAIYVGRWCKFVSGTAPSVLKINPSFCFVRHMLRSDLFVF